MCKEGHISLLDILIDEEEQLWRDGSFLLVLRCLLKRNKKFVIEDGLDVDMLVEVAHNRQDVIGIFSDARMFLDREVTGT